MYWWLTRISSFGAKGFSPTSPSSFNLNRNNFKGGPKEQASSIALLSSIVPVNGTPLFMNGVDYTPITYREDEVWEGQARQKGQEPPSLRVMPTSYTDL